MDQHHWLDATDLEQFAVGLGRHPSVGSRAFGEAFRNRETLGLVGFAVGVGTAAEYVRATIA